MPTTINIIVHGGYDKALRESQSLIPSSAIRATVSITPTSIGRSQVHISYQDSVAPSEYLDLNEFFNVNEQQKESNNVKK